VLLTDEQAVRTSTDLSSVIYYMWAAAGSCETFLKTVIFSTFCKVRSQVPGTVAVLEGQDSKTCTSLTQILTLLTYCCGDNALLHIVIGL
jgi:hypothetical protein